MTDVPTSTAGVVYHATAEADPHRVEKLANPNGVRLFGTRLKAAKETLAGSSTAKNPFFGTRLDWAARTFKKS